MSNTNTARVAKEIFGQIVYWEENVVDDNLFKSKIQSIIAAAIAAERARFDAVFAKLVERGGELQQQLDDVSGSLALRDADVVRLQQEREAMRAVLDAFMEPMRRYTKHFTWTKGDEGMLISAYDKAKVALAAQLNRARL